MMPRRTSPSPPFLFLPRAPISPRPQPSPLLLLPAAPSPLSNSFSPFPPPFLSSPCSSRLRLYPLASAAVPIATASKTTQEDDEQWLGFPGSRLALLLSGLEDDEQWLGFPGPPSSRCSPGFPPPKGCLISSSINSWSSSRKR
ncbi:hypothetical protein Droror1_Dr00010677 [Drosera rotundifolia]